MALSRREFVARLMAMMGAIPVLNACDDGGGDTGDALGVDGLPLYEYSGEKGPEDSFRHGVASGDPLTNAVILWTHVTLGDLFQFSTEVFVEIAKKPDFKRRVVADYVSTDDSRGRTVKLDINGLEPGTTYYYRFSANGRTSPIGRTKTLPEATDHVRLGVCSCSNMGHGYFHAYRMMGRRADLDAVVHLGDYIYEYAMEGFGTTYGTVRPLEPPHEIIRLDDYRERYASYRRDEALAELHRQHPMIHIWDDHEFADDPFVGGAVEHDPESEGLWEDRVRAALQAYHEWMPTRMPERERIYRQFRWGDLVRLVLVDRQRKYLWPEGDDTYLGETQASWLDNQIRVNTQQWFVLGQGTDFGPRQADGLGGSDWDEESRLRIRDGLEDAGVENFVVLTGDMHRADAVDIVQGVAGYDPATGEGAWGTEFSCNSITSQSGPVFNNGVPQWPWSTGLDRGYMVVDITPERLQTDFYGFFDILVQDPTEPAEEHQASFRVEAGVPHVVEVSEPVATDPDAPEFAP